MSLLRYGGPSPFYRELSELPVPTSAQFIDTTAPSGVSVVRISYSVRDHERNAKRSTTKSLTIATGNPGSRVINSPVISSTINHDSSEVLASLFAPSGKRHAFLKEVSDGNGTKKRYVEVWEGTQLEASMEVTKKHDQFYTDDYFKSFSFTPSESAFVYTAEANLETADTPEDDPYPKFRFVPHFGEQLHTKKRPTLFVFRWRHPNDSLHSGGNKTSAASVTALTLNQPPDTPVLFGQATFTSETRLFATGYEQTDDGRHLGVKGCFNRSANIWELILPGDSIGTAAMTACESVKIETPGRHSRSPRILFDTDRVPGILLWLSNPRGGAHASTVTLHARDLKGTSGNRALVDVVEDPLAHEFPGLYTDYNLADNPFLRLGNKTYVLVQSLWHARQTLMSIDVENGTAIDLTPVSEGQALYSWNLLGTDGIRSVVCSRSTPTSPPETILLSLIRGDVASIQILDSPNLSPKLQEAIDHIDASVIPIPDRYPVETIVIRSKTLVQGPKPVCLTIPHGGPHAASVTSFTPGVLAYVLEGYTVSLPNYTGSTGYGETYVQKLIGQCGMLDVADCLATVQHLDKLGLSEPRRHVIHGGSHGGFLAAHLIGQNPHLFRAAVLRNPVTSAGELCTSDIPDWAFREFGLAYSMGAHVTPERFATLYAASPIAHVAHVRTPVLILLGEDDLRVPPTQGRGYYHALKGRGQAVELLVFPKETHPIDGVEAARVAFDATRDWFRAAFMTTQEWQRGRSEPSSIA